jgi:hypothetical protein
MPLAKDGGQANSLPTRGSKDIKMKKYLTSTFNLYLILMFPLVISFFIPKTYPVSIVSKIDFLIYIIIYCTWILWLDFELYNSLSSEFRKKINKRLHNFNIFFLVFFISFLALTMFFENIQIDKTSYYFQLINIFLMFVGFWGVFSFWYCIFFVAKCIVIFEQKTSLKKTTMLVYFIFLLLLPIGFWVIQPKIKAILEE